MGPGPSPRHAKERARVILVSSKSASGTTHMNRIPLPLLRRRTARVRSHIPTARAGKPVLPVDWIKVGLLVLTVAALSALMTINLLPDKISLRLGDVSPREVRAQRSVIYISTTETARLQQAAMQATPPVYDTDESAASGADRTVQDLFDRIDEERLTLSRDTRPGTISQTVATLQPQFGTIFTSAQLRYLLTAPPPVLQNLRVTAARLVSAEMDRDIRDNSADLQHARTEVAEAARREVASSQGAAIVRAVASQALRPTQILNRRKTEAAREAAARAVPPISYRMTRGDQIIGPGETVTQEHLDKFTALGLLNPHLELTTGATVCILAAAMVLLVVLFIARTLPALYKDRRRLALLAVIVLLSVFGLKVGATMLGLSFGGGQPGYLGMMSVAAAGMLVSVLLDANLAVLIVALLAVQSGLIMNHEIRFTVMTLMSSLVGILCIGSGRTRHNLLKTTMALAGANLALVWLLGLLLRDSLGELGAGSAWAVGAAAFAAFLFWFGLLALEKPFGILTHTALLELSATDQPLLQQLCAIAPGTYAHSMLVGTLAEAGARAIGADPLLCRVGGYYHDIGKMKRPEFFVENQRRENVHGRLSASLSALIIAAHVRDGVEMALQHRLPAEIRDIIAQHHGTTLIRYFYHQALADCGGSEEAPPGLEERFRYPGPRPQTREAAIVMLADTVEAAARCLDRPSMERLEVLIANLLREKIEDGQLDECPLTFRDLRGIAAGFLHVLAAMMHERIDYPSLDRSSETSPMKVAPAEPIEASLPLTRTEALADLPAAVERSESLGADPESGVLDPTLRPLCAADFGEPEVFYGSLPLERTDTSGSDSSPAPGRPPSARRRGDGERGSQRRSQR